VAAVILESDLSRESGVEAQARDTHPRVLLGRRVPGVSRGGLWCLPCGYVEYDEDVREALAREIREETGLVVEAQELVAVHSNFHEPDRQTVGIWFRVRAIGGALLPGDDVDDLRFVPPGDPGVPLAFPTDAFVLTEIAGIRYHL
jgi:ADP-ribose pyrophosphatase YjhB (NUDIX family)